MHYKLVILKLGCILCVWKSSYCQYTWHINHQRVLDTGWRTKCHTIDCERNIFLLLQKHLTSGTGLIFIGRKIVPNEEHFQCDHRFASEPLANEPLHSSQLFDTSSESAQHNFTMWALSCATFSVSKSCDECKGSFARGCEAKRWSHWKCSSLGTIFQPMRINSVPDVKCFCNNKNVLRAQSMVW